ncbi:unnamed protein product [Meloidogyne enterolobii]|uniref:Uncharacterized protein n=1 Tax=Meloidogyne enterolobii TaxID=390850 RepID=A0ACB0Z688_MELEN
MGKRVVVRELGIRYKDKSRSSKSNLKSGIFGIGRYGQEGSRPRAGSEGS